MSNISVCLSQVIPNVSNLQEGIRDCYNRHTAVCHWKSASTHMFDQQPDGSFYHIYLIWNTHGIYNISYYFGLGECDSTFFKIKLWNMVAYQSTYTIKTLVSITILEMRWLLGCRTGKLNKIWVEEK